MYSALETSADGRIELPRNVGSTKDQYALRVTTHTVHLHEKLCLDTSRGLGFTFTSRTTEGVDLVDKDNGWLVLASHVEKLFY